MVKWCCVRAPTLVHALATLKILIWRESIPPFNHLSRRLSLAKKKKHNNNIYTDATWRSARAARTYTIAFGVCECRKTEFFSNFRMRRAACFFFRSPADSLFHFYLHIKKRNEAINEIKCKCLCVAKTANAWRYSLEKMMSAKKIVRRKH